MVLVRTCAKHAHIHRAGIFVDKMYGSFIFHFIPEFPMALIHSIRRLVLSYAQRKAVPNPRPPGTRSGCVNVNAASLQALEHPLKRAL